MALEHRLNDHSRESGVSVDRLRRRVVFERVVARLTHAEPGKWQDKPTYPFLSVTDVTEWQVDRGHARGELASHRCVRLGSGLNHTPVVQGEGRWLN